MSTLHDLVAKFRLGSPDRAGATCQHCQKEMTGRTNKKYCSAACRASAWRKRQSAEDETISNSNRSSHAKLMIRGLRKKALDGDESALDHLKAIESELEDTALEIKRRNVKHGS